MTRADRKNSSPDRSYSSKQLLLFHYIVHDSTEHIVHDRYEGGEETQDEEDDADYIFADRVGSVVLSENFFCLGWVDQKLCCSVPHLPEIFTIITIF